jgi:hypothetical protein
MFYALTRGDARRLFALQGEAVWDFAADLACDDEVASEGRKLACEADWEGLHRILAANGYPLNHCVLGGREMTAEQSRGRVILKRPDVVAHIAEVLAKSAPGENQPLPLHELRDFYRRAADQKSAVLFVSENEAGE